MTIERQIEVIKKSGLFDEDYYLNIYPDVKEAGMNPIHHYVLYGASECRNPSRNFDTDFYYQSNYEVYVKGENPLVHYILMGKKAQKAEKPIPEKAIIVCYHIATMGYYKALVQEQLNLIKKSGLGQECYRIYINVAGEKSIELALLLLSYPFSHKMRISHQDNLYHWEFPTIKIVQKVAEEQPTTKILYFHTKGASKSGETLDFQKRMWAWRRYMEYFNIEKWRNCVKALDSHDCCGVDWIFLLPDKIGYFGGNFWWANGTYINRCQKDYVDYHPAKSRIAAEFFIGTAPTTNVKSFLNSWENPGFQNQIPQQEREKYADPISFLRFSGVKVFDWRSYLYEDKYYRR